MPTAAAEFLSQVSTGAFEGDACPFSLLECLFAPYHLSTSRITATCQEPLFHLFSQIITKKPQKMLLPTNLSHIFNNESPTQTGKAFISVL